MDNEIVLIDKHISNCFTQHTHIRKRCKYNTRSNTYTHMSVMNQPIRTLYRYNKEDKKKEKSYLLTRQNDHDGRVNRCDLLFCKIKNGDFSSIWPVIDADF